MNHNHDRLMGTLNGVAAALCILAAGKLLFQTVNAMETIRMADEVIAESQTVLVWEPAIPIEPMAVEFEDGEDPDEDAKIEAALLESGYLREDVPLDYDLQSVLRAVCEANGVDYALALGLIETESNFQPDADNGQCYGLCQLNRTYFPDNLTTAENITAGISYLGELLERYGNERDALTAYNSGHPGASRYALAVLRAAEKWK